MVVMPHVKEVKFMLTIIKCVCVYLCITVLHIIWVIFMHAYISVNYNVYIFHCSTLFISN